MFKKAFFCSFLIISCPYVHSEQQVTRLTSDGPNNEHSAYDLIRKFAGPRSIESPDLYPDNHPGFPHIFEDTDEEVGHHFVFVLHRDVDKDRDKYIKFNDRQRNEIKAYSKSKKALKAYEDETLKYKWKFKLPSDMSLSNNFSHFFQLKSVDDGVGQPIFTFSGRSYKNQKWFALSHAGVQKASIIAKKPWQNISDVWLEAECKVTYSNEGKLEVTIKRLDQQEVLIHFESENIDMWRGTDKRHFVRPKWGYYRSLKSKSMLANEKDSIRFADFEVIKY